MIFFFFFAYILLFRLLGILAIYFHYLSLLVTFTAELCGILTAFAVKAQNFLQFLLILKVCVLQKPFSCCLGFKVKFCHVPTCRNIHKKFICFGKI